MRTLTKRSLIVASLVALTGMGMLTHSLGSTAAPATLNTTAPDVDVIACAAKVSTLYSFDPSRPVDAQNQTQRAYFTPEGWAGYQQALNDSLTPKAVTAEHMSVITRPTGPLSIVARGLNAQGHPTWTVVQPMERQTTRLNGQPVTTRAELALRLVQVGTTAPQRTVRIETLVLTPKHA